MMLSADGSRYEGQFKDGKKCKGKIFLLLHYLICICVFIYVCIENIYCIIVSVGMYMLYLFICIRLCVSYVCHI